MVKKLDAITKSEDADMYDFSLINKALKNGINYQYIELS